MPENGGRGAVAGARIQAVAEEILSGVQNLSPEVLYWIPGEGVWSIMDNLCHIREFLPYWTDQAVRIAQDSGEQWGRNHADAARLAAVTNTAEYRLEDVAADIRRLARESAAALGKLSDADLAREATSRNPRWGLKPASFVVDHLLVEHVEKHMGQIRRNLTQFGGVR